jgi:hypothetical protein
LSLVRALDARATLLTSERREHVEDSERRRAPGKGRRATAGRQVRVGVSVAIGVGAIVGDAFAAVERPALSKRVVPTAEASLESLLQALTVEQTRQIDCCHRKPRECRAILWRRRSCQDARTSWWSGGDSNRMPLANAFAGMRHFSIERDYLLREIPTPAYRSFL